MKTTGRIRAALAAVTSGIFAAVTSGIFAVFVALTAGQYAIGIWGALTLITFASVMGAIWAQKAPSRAAAIFFVTSIAWAWFGAIVFGQTLNVITAPFMAVTALAGALLLWASLKAPSDDATAPQ